MYEGIEVEIYSRNDLVTPLTNVPRRWQPTLLEELNRDGGGSFRVRNEDAIFDDVPSALDEGNLVRVVLDGGLEHWWEIANRKDIEITDGEWTGQWTEVAGPGVRSWMGHATVYPEAGLVKSPGDRQFNFTSKQGSWYVPAQWVTATVNESVGAGGGTRPGVIDWPVNIAASWIWSTAHTPPATAPVGEAYFRHEFTLASAQKVKLFATADDIALFFLDGARVLSVTQFGASKKLFTAEFTIPAGTHVFAIRAKNNSGAAGVAYAICKLREGADSDDEYVAADRLQWSGTGAKVMAYPASPPGWTIGQILNTLMDEAEDRGVDGVGRILRSWTDALDSNGVPWASVTDLVFETGAPYTDVLTQLTDAYVDIWFEGREMSVAPVRGVDRSVQVGAADPVVFRSGLSVLGSESESTAEIANVALVNTANGLVERLGPASSLTQFGRRESYLSAVNASESGTAGALIDQLFMKYAEPRRTPTLKILPTDGNVPWVDLQVGDWVLAPSDEGGSKLKKRRIVSLSVTEGEESGELSFEAEIDTIQSTREERLARWLQAVENGTKQGGVSGTSSSGEGSTEFGEEGSGASSPAAPSLPNQSNPNAPTNLLVTADTYQDDSKIWRGKATLSWAHDGKDTSGRAMVAVRYEMTWRPTGTTDPWQTKVVDGALIAVCAPLDILKADRVTVQSYTFAVRAVGPNGRTSGWSQQVSVAMVKDTTAPGRPYFVQANVTTWMRTVRVSWNGKLTDAGLSAQLALPADFSHVNIYQSSSATMVGKVLAGRLNGANEIWVTDKVPAGAAVYFTLTAVDTSGNESVDSAIKNVTPTANVNAAEIIATLDAGVVTLTNVGSAALATGAVLAQHLADNSITMTALGTLKLALANLDTAANTKIQKGIDDAFTAQTAANTANTAAGTAQTAANLAQEKVDNLAAQGPSVIPNGDFDRPLVGGSTFPVDWWSRSLAYCEIDARARSGTQLLRLNPSTVSAYAYTKAIPAAPGQTFHLEMWARLNTALVVTDPAIADVNFTVQVTKSDGTTYQIIPTDGTMSVSDLTTTGWTNVKAQFTLSPTSGAVSIRVGPRATGNGNSYLIDDIRGVDITQAQAAIDAAALAQTKANTAFADAQQALTNAGLAQTAANLKATVYYGPTAPAGSGFAVNDVWFKSPGNQIQMWDGDSWEPRVDNAIAAANQAAVDAGSTAVGMANVSTSPAPATLAVAGGAIWQQVEAANTDRIIATWVAGNDKVWKPRTIEDSVLGNINAVKVTAGTMSALRMDAADMRARWLTAGKITAGDMVANTITAASGIIGSLDIGKVTTGTMSGIYITAKTLRAESLAVTDLTSFAPSLAESPDDWELTGGMTIVGSGVDPSGKRFNAVDNTGGSAIARGPYKSVQPGEKLYAYTKVYRSGGTQYVYLRYYWYDGTRTALATPYTDVEAGAVVGNSGTLSGAVAAPAGAAYGRLFILAGSGTGSVGFYNMAAFKQTGSVLIEDGAVTATQVNAASVAGAVGSFLTINVSQLNATAAAIGTGVIDKLYTDVVRSRKIETDMLAVTGENLVPDPYFVDSVQNAYRLATGGPHTLAVDDTSTAGTLKTFVHSATETLIHLHTPQSLIRVGPAEQFNFVINYRNRGTTVAASTTTMRIGIFQYSPTGGFLRTVYLPTKTLTGATGAAWQTQDEGYTMPVDVGGIRLVAYVSNMASTGEFEIKNPRLKRKISNALVVDGGIVTRHLTVTSDMTVALLAAHKVVAGEIDTNSLSADSAFIGSMKTSMLTADVITSTMIHATGGITSKHTITGATFQTHAAANTGIKIEGAYLRAYNAANVETFAISGVTGNVVGTGQWRTGTGGNYINMIANAQGGILQFFTGNGSGRGSVWARDDVTDGPKMSIAYSDLDEPSGMLPVIVAMPSKVYMRYGSRALNVGLIGGVETLEIDCTGAAAVMRGNFDMRDGGSRTQYRYGTTSSLGYVGQRPESGSTADFEIRAEVGGVRITGAMTNFQTYNVSTTGTANVNVDATGLFRRSTSASRYKLDQKELPVRMSALDVKVKDWIDIGEKARLDELAALSPEEITEELQREWDSINRRRIPGLVAEDLVEAGQSQFVIFGPDGQTEGVMYERFAFMQIAAVHQKLNAAVDRIEELERILNG